MLPRALGTGVSPCLSFDKFKVSSELAGESRESCCGSQGSLDSLPSAFTTSHSLCLRLQAYEVEVWELGGG